MSSSADPRAGRQPGVHPALALLGWDAGWRATCRTVTADLRSGAGARLPVGTPLRAARVVRTSRGACDLLSAGGQVRATWGADVVRASALRPEAVPVTGDWVLLAHWPDARTTVEVVLPRRTALRRAQVAAGSSHAQVLAANVDAVAVVEGLAPDPHPGRVERLLAVARASRATPVVVLTKADLVPDVEAMVAEVAALAPGCAVLAVSAPAGRGVQPLRDSLAGGATLALLGGSGVGKSTLVNALVGGVAMRTRALRGDGKGRHTTVTRELHLVPGGGAVIDTPGLRSVGLVGGEPLGEVFPDVEDLARSCRFADCAHGVEPGCAVLAAVEAGDLAERRIAGYRKLRREAEGQAVRTTARPGAGRARPRRDAPDQP